VIIRCDEGYQQFPANYSWVGWGEGWGGGGGGGGGWCVRLDLIVVATGTYYSMRVTDALSRWKAACPDEVGRRALGRPVVKGVQQYLD